MSDIPAEIYAAVKLEELLPATATPHMQAAIPVLVVTNYVDGRSSTV